MRQCLSHEFDVPTPQARICCWPTANGRTRRLTRQLRSGCAQLRGCGVAWHWRAQAHPVRDRGFIEYQCDRSALARHDCRGVATVTPVSADQSVLAQAFFQWGRRRHDCKSSNLGTRRFGHSLRPAKARRQVRREQVLPTDRSVVARPLLYRCTRPLQSWSGAFMSCEEYPDVTLQMMIK
jgi:hypothetical protein